MPGLRSTARSVRRPVSEIEIVREIRHKSRTDLGFLCRDLLGYRDIVDTELPHGILLKPLSLIFASCQGRDVYTPASHRFLYIPRGDTPSSTVPLEIKRNYGIFVPRSWQKTTINTIAHTVMGILNFPLSTNLVYHNTEEEALPIMNSIIDHFLIEGKDGSTHTLADFYPEYCMSSRELRASMRLGQLFHPLRKIIPGQMPVQKEGTLGALGLNSSQAGRHCDSIKFADVVEKKNSGNDEAVRKTASDASTAMSLRIDFQSFVYVEGTTYHGEDWYEKLMQAHFFKVPVHLRTWHFIFSSCYKRDVPGGQKFTPDERDKPYSKAATTYKVGSVTIKKGALVPGYPVWENRLNQPPAFPNEGLDQLKREDPENFAYQYLLCPTLVRNNKHFPADAYREYPGSSIEIERSLTDTKDFDIITTDLAETDLTASDDVILTWCSVLQNGHVVVREVDISKREPEDTVETLLSLVAQVKPLFVSIEDVSFTKGLLVSLYRRAEERRIMLPLVLLKRPRRIDKHSRIRGALRVPYTRGQLSFAACLPDHVKQRIKHELGQFLTTSKDDVLDTLADVFLTTQLNSERIYEERQARLARLKRPTNFVYARLFNDEVPLHHEAKIVDCSSTGLDVKVVES